MDVGTARQIEKEVRGTGRGRNFFALGHPVWEQLWTAKTANRLNVILTYLVLLAGTGSDHRLTKWSAKACEEHLGIGKPRAKAAIEELIAAGLISRTAESTQLKPQYQLSPLAREETAIFLPVQIVTGLGHATPVLRRIRETGDALLLRMLIDLYGLVQLDATYGVPIADLRQWDNQSAARKIMEVGVHAVWSLTLGDYRSAQGDWTSVHYETAATLEASWAAFWGRLDTLKKIGALWFEPWAFDGNELDAEPILPVDLSPPTNAEADLTMMLTRECQEAAWVLAAERTYLFEKYAADFYLPLPVHHRPPAMRGVAKLVIEPDTPGRRLAYARRMSLIEQRRADVTQLIEDAAAGRYNRPAAAKLSREAV